MAFKFKKQRHCGEANDALPFSAILPDRNSRTTEMTRKQQDST